MYLLGGIAAREAREKVAIYVRHTTLPGISNSGDSVGVNMSTRLVHTDHSEMVVIRSEAGEAAGGGALRHIDAIIRDSLSDQGKTQQSKEKLHVQEGNRLLLMTKNC